MTDVDVAVIGAGIAGLTAAYSLREAGREVRVFEASDRVGGRMATVRAGGYVIDTGAEQIPSRGYPATWQLIDELGITGVPRIGRQVAMWRDGKARTGVAHPRGLLTGAGLSVRARIDMLSAMCRRATGTVAQFAEPYHPDFLNYLCQPVVSGFFGWDPARSAAEPFLELLTGFGSSSGWRTYRDGMDTMARVLASTVDVEFGFGVDEIVVGAESVRVVSGTTEVLARSVILAVPAPVVCQIYEDAPEFVRACSFTPMVKVHLMLDHRPSSRAYLVAVPSVEDEVVSVILYDHLKHSDRAPEGRGLVTLIANPSVVPSLLEQPDDVVAKRLLDAASALVPELATGVRGHVVHRFQHGLPEATPAALALRDDFAAHCGGVVDYAGDWVGLSPCSESAVRSGRRAATRVVSRRELV